MSEQLITVDDDGDVGKQNKIIVKWSSKEYTIDTLENSDSVAKLKQCIYEQTRVKPERQKLLGLKTKNRKPLADETTIDELSLSNGGKIMMVGSCEEEIANIDLDPEDIPHVVNDFDIDEDLGQVAIHNRGEYLTKIDKRIKEIKIQVFNPPRPGKKLLVLDIDYTLFDHRSTAEHASQLMRPHLHEFLESAYQDYDIVIWSATSMKWIEVKMRELGVTGNANYKIAFFMDSTSMISVSTSKYGIINVKPLGVIWGKFPQYNAKNTIMFDDLRRNFLMNPQNGLKIKPFRNSFDNRNSDKELLKLARYLRIIASNYNDFSHLDHDHWYRMI